MKPLLWAELSQTELLGRRDEGALELALLPVGGTAPHAAHLPAATDSLLCQTLCHAVSAQTGALVLPTIAYGVSARAGNLKVAPATLTALVGDAIEAVWQFGVPRVIVLSGNAENLPAIECALQTLRARHAELLCVGKPVWDANPQTRDAWHFDSPAPHAGVAETSLLQFLAPRLVGPLPSDEPARAEPIFLDECAPFRGTPAGATPELGAELFEALVNGWTRFVKRALVENSGAQLASVPKAPPQLNGAGLFRAPP